MGNYIRRFGGLLAVAAIVASFGSQAATVRVDEAFRLASDGVIKPFEDLNQTALQKRPGRIQDSRLDNNRGHYVYQLEILDAKGAQWAVNVDAVTGQFIDEKRKE